MLSLVFTTHFHVYSLFSKENKGPIFSGAQIMLTELRDSSIQADISEFLIHIVNSSSRLVSKNNTVGSDGSLTLFEDLLAILDSFSADKMSLTSLTLRISP